MLTYKNYIAEITFDDEINTFHGEVINTRDVITFQGTSVNELKKAFKDSIDDYLDFCAKRKELPEKPFSGKFNIRLKPNLHREAYIAARRCGKSLNQWVADTIAHNIHC